MNNVKLYIKSAVKVLISFSIPLFLLILFYGIVLGFNFNWSYILYYAPIFALASAHHYMPSTLISKEKISNDSSAILKSKLKSAPWEIVDETENTIILRPKFDRPHTWIWREQVLLDLSGYRVSIVGAKAYTKRLQALVESKKTLWDRSIFRVFFSLLLILLLLFPVFYKYGLINDMKIRLHDYKTRNIDLIELDKTGVAGNTEDNINSYGGTVESEDYFFYVKENLKLCRSDKNFKNEKVLINKQGGSSISYLNASGEWIFFASGKTFNRIKTDGSKQETIYNLGYLIDVHLLDNWIYFINYSDQSKLYKMDINGKNLHPLNDIEIQDFSIYDGRIYFSHEEKDGQGTLKSMDLDGKDIKTIANILPFDLVKNGDTLYYTDKRNFNLYKCHLDENSRPVKLVKKELSMFILAGDSIYYSLRSTDVYYPGTGLYKIGLDGGPSEMISDDNSIEHLSRIGDWLLFHSSKENEWPSLKRMSLKNQTIISMD